VLRSRVIALSGNQDSVRRLYAGRILNTIAFKSTTRVQPACTTTNNSQQNVVYFPFVHCIYYTAQVRQRFKRCFHYGCAVQRCALRAIYSAIVSDIASAALCSATYRYISLTIARNAQRSRSGNRPLVLPVLVYVV